MPSLTTIAVVGDFKEENPAHRATNEALRHAAAALGLTAGVDWIPTPVPETAEGRARLAEYNAVFSAPGSPYQSMNGALEAIRFAREQGWPYFAT